MPAESFILAEIDRNSLEHLKLTGTSRNLIQGGTGGTIVPVYMSVRNFPAILARMEQN